MAPITHMSDIPTGVGCHMLQNVNNHTNSDFLVFTKKKLKK